MGRRYPKVAKLVKPYYIFDTDEMFFLWDLIEISLVADHDLDDAIAEELIKETSTEIVTERKSVWVVKIAEV